jgi:hypothetical protein
MSGPYPWSVLSSENGSEDPDDFQKLKQTLQEEVNQSRTKGFILAFPSMLERIANLLPDNPLPLLHWFSTCGILRIRDHYVIRVKVLSAFLKVDKRTIYRYLDALGWEEVPFHVNHLEEYASLFDNSSFYVFNSIQTRFINNVEPEPIVLEAETQIPVLFPKDNWTKLKMKLSRKSKALKASERENAALQRALTLATIVPENPDEEETVLVNDETDADESLTRAV